MVDKNVILITRTWCSEKTVKKEYNKDIKKFIENIHGELSRIIVLVNFEEETDYYTQTLLRGFDDIIFNKIEIYHVKPWGVASGALNIGLTKAFNHKEKPDHILIASSEVSLDESNVKIMSQELSKNSNMLVVGYALKAYTDDNYKFKGCEKGHILENNYEVYKTPWNTCAMWDAELFRKYVGAFNVICDCPKYLGKKKIKLNGKEEKIELRGIEDALAMTSAQKVDSNLKIGIIKKALPWKVKKEKIKDHKIKMKRKCAVYEKYKKIFDIPKPLISEPIN
ncbi:hypothetical protein KJA15_02025 [Patescibacteria group bacterium]|nr:hypothetical protein [Patescibacteria group bacterium]